MKVLRIIATVLMVFSIPFCQSLFASETILLECQSGDFEKLEGYLANSDFCYRAKLICAKGTLAGFGPELFEDGFMVAGFGGAASDVEDVSGCNGITFHMLNNQWSHTCSFKGGKKIHYRVHAVNSRFCRE